jgi:hypothetical protein
MRAQVLLLSAATLLLLPASNARSDQAIRLVAFHVDQINGSPTGNLSMTGGGILDPAAGLVKLGGGFRCLSDVNQGPLAGLKAGEGTHWRATQILPSTVFKCTGNASEALKTAVTDANTVVFLAEFFRAGDGATPSFTARVFVSSTDSSPDILGNQNVWVQGVGCGDGRVTLR